MGVERGDREAALRAAAQTEVLLPFVDELDVLSVSRNGDRLDAEVQAGARRWWLVRHGEGVPVTFERPGTSLGPVDGGVVVVLNGLSSAGKSSVVRAVVEGSDEPWVGFDEPFFGVVRPEVLIWPEQAPTVWSGFLAGISALAAEGNRVIAASGGLPHGQWRAAMGSNRLIAVALDCPPDVLAARHRVRSDRRGDLHDSSTVHDSWTYDQRFDSSAMGPGEIAEAIGALTR